MRAIVHAPAQHNRPQNCISSARDADGSERGIERVENQLGPPDALNPLHDVSIVVGPCDNHAVRKYRTADTNQNNVALMKHRFHTFARHLQGDIRTWWEARRNDDAVFAFRIPQFPSRSCGNRKIEEWRQAGSR